MPKPEAQVVAELVASIRQLQRSRYWTQISESLRTRIENAVKEVKS